MVYFGKSMSKSFQSAAEAFHSNIWFFHCTSICEPTFKEEGFYSVKGSPDHVHAVQFDGDTNSEPVRGQDKQTQSKLTVVEDAKESTKE